MVWDWPLRIRIQTRPFLYRFCVGLDGRYWTRRAYLGLHDGRCKKTFGRLFLFSLLPCLTWLSWFKLKAERLKTSQLIWILLYLLKFGGTFPSLILGQASGRDCSIYCIAPVSRRALLVYLCFGVQVTWDFSASLRDASMARPKKSDIRWERAYMPTVNGQLTRSNFRWHSWWVCYTVAHSFVSV